MCEKISITETFDNINLKKTMENVAKWKYTDDDSYVDVDGISLENIIKENENPDYVYKGEDEEFLKYLEKYIDEAGVYIALGDGADVYLTNAFRSVEIIIPKTPEEKEEYLQKNPEIENNKNILFFKTEKEGEYDNVSCDDYMTGFGAYIYGNSEKGFKVTYGVQSHYGPCWNPPSFSSHDDDGNRNSSWDIACPLCQKVIELSREMINTDEN